MKIKNFVKERNPFLLISFIFSILVFFVIILYSKDNFVMVKALMTGSKEYYIDLALISFFTITFVFFVLISLFNMIGFLYQKQEYIFISIGLLVVLSASFAFNNQIVLSIIAIIWCVINVLGLMKKRN